MFQTWIKKHEPVRLRKGSNKSGVALVELAIQLPVYFLIFGLFFDLLAGFVA
jgi:Flp pilus assembly protein TadG